MVWWISAGGAVLGLLILAIAAVPVLRRIGPLKAGLESLMGRKSDAEALQGRVTALQAELAVITERLPGKPSGTADDR